MVPVVPGTESQSRIDLRETSNTTLNADWPSSVSCYFLLLLNAGGFALTLYTSPIVHEVDDFHPRDGLETFPSSDLTSLSYASCRPRTGMSLILPSRVPRPHVAFGYLELNQAHVFWPSACSFCCRIPAFLVTAGYQYRS